MNKPTSLQEKSQVTLPPTSDDEPHTWATFEQARNPDVGAHPGGKWEPSRADSVDTRRFNKMPMDMEMSACEYTPMPCSLAGETDASKDTNPEAIREGFSKGDLNGYDDQATGKRQDLFYGNAGGFLERNNYLDRV